MTIYVDELFMNNFVMTYLILFFTKKVLNKKCKSWRMIVSSIVSSMLSIILIIYDKNDNIFLKIGVLLITCYIAFSTGKNNKIMPEMFIAIIVTLILGGILASSINRTIEIALIFVISILGIKQYNEYYKAQKWSARNTYRLKIKIQNKTIHLKAFLDTGNMLQEKFSGESVIIICKSAIKDKISTNILQAIENGNFEKIDFNILKNIRPITYSVINEDEKIMYGLKIKNVEILSESTKIVNDAVITITNNKIEKADALIGINLLEGGYENGNLDNVKTKNNEIIC